MIANALFAATGLMLALLFLLAGQLRFLIPYRLLLIHQYGTTILIAAAVLFLNLIALLFTLGRRVFLLAEFFEEL